MVQCVSVGIQYKENVDGLSSCAGAADSVIICGGYNANTYDIPTNVWEYNVKKKRYFTAFKNKCLPV